MKKVPVYFNSNLELKYDKKYARLTDRAKIWKLLPAILVGVFCLCWGFMNG